MDQTLKVERARRTSGLRKYKNRRLYDVLASAYVTLADESIRRRLLGGEPVLGGLDCRTDVTAEVLAGLVSQEVHAGRISTAQLLTFLKEALGHAPAVREDRARSPARLV